VTIRPAEKAGELEATEPCDDRQEQSHEHTELHETSLHLLTSSRVLEPDVLQCFSRSAVEPRGLPVVPPLGGEIAASDPAGGAMADRGHLLERRIRFLETLVCLIQSVLLEKRAAQHELGRPALMQVIVASFEKL
jgi:hypothetical protein